MFYCQIVKNDFNTWMKYLVGAAIRGMVYGIRNVLYLTMSFSILFSCMFFEVFGLSSPTL